MLTINSNLTAPHREHPEKRISKNSRIPQPILTISQQLKRYCGRSLNYTMPYPKFQHRVHSHTCTIMYKCWQSKFTDNSRVPALKQSCEWIHCDLKAIIIVSLSLLQPRLLLRFNQKSFHQSTFAISTHWAWGPAIGKDSKVPMG